MWLTQLKKLRLEKKSKLDGIKDQGASAARLAELIVTAGVETPLSNLDVSDAAKRHRLLVHGVLSDIGNGKLRDLRVVDSKRGFSKATNTVRGNHGMLVFGGVWGYSDDVKNSELMERKALRCGV